MSCCPVGTMSHCRNSSFPLRCPNVPFSELVGITEYRDNYNDTLEQQDIVKTGHRKVCAFLRLCFSTTQKMQSLASVCLDLERQRRFTKMLYLCTKFMGIHKRGLVNSLHLAVVLHTMLELDRLHHRVLHIRGSLKIWNKLRQAPSDVV